MKNKKTKRKAAEAVGDKQAIEEPREAAHEAAGEVPSAEGPSPAAEAVVLAERLLRLQADFENYRKRMLRERQETYRQANEDIMQELLPVLDHLELALKAAADHDADQAMVQGFRLVAEQLRSALGKFGLEAVDAEGEAFDPNLHEAISHVQSPQVPADHVMAQTRRGYRLGARLLRAAQVVVSSGSGEEPGPEAEPQAPAEAAAHSREPAEEVKD